MAVHLRTNTRNADQYEDLLARLLKEWRAPQASESAEPLYVVWSEWRDLTPVERSKVVLQAYTQFKGQDLANSVTLAMGLTPDEAEKIGIKLD